MTVEGLQICTDQLKCLCFSCSTLRSSAQSHVYMRLPRCDALCLESLLPALPSSTCQKHTVKPINFVCGTSTLPSMLSLFRLSLNHGKRVSRCVQPDRAPQTLTI